MKEPAMRRLILAIVFCAAVFSAAPPASAFWGHRHCGWRGGWCGGYGWGGCGYGGYGYGGYGWRGYGWRGYGWRGYGWRGYYPGYAYRGFGYRGFYGVGYPYFGYGATFVPSYYYSPYRYYNFGYPYYGYGFFGAVNRPSTNLIVNSSSLPLVQNNFVLAKASQPEAPPTALALQKFLGLKSLPATVQNGAGLAVVANPFVTPKSLDDVLARVSNVESRRKAERIIAEGDELFRAQNFHSALQKYKLAVSAAPDVAEALWRQGHALVATHNYELAAKAFKRAIAHTEDLSRDGFQLNDIYAGAAITKSQHLEFLAEWALDRENSSDAYFLLGVFLNYDGQSARAEKFFQRASDLAGISGGHIAVFLDQPEAHPTVQTVPVSAATEI
jgi:tetratricopeptide (TPR) repeat protein